jgi:hypothetical protein
MMQMQPSRKVAVVEELDVDADTLWSLISDFEHIDRWANLAIRSVEGNAVGCLRTVEMESGALVTERLLARDEDHRIYTYEVVEPNPYPMHAYTSTMSIEALSAQRCRLRWTGSYLPVENTDPLRTDRLLLKVYGAGIELLRKYCA